MKSQYKYVYYRSKSRDGSAYGMKATSEKPWEANVKAWDFQGHVGLGCKRFATEREAAIHVDRILLEHGRKPVNILKPKP